MSSRLVAGKNSEDPEVEEQFLRDPQTYRTYFLGCCLCNATLSPLEHPIDGKLRVGTGLAILEVSSQLFRSTHTLSTRADECFQGLTNISAIMSNLKIPFIVCHGTGDRFVHFLCASPRDCPV
jgi:acylglycerol lipase